MAKGTEYDAIRAWEDRTPEWYEKVYTARPEIFRQVFDWIRDKMVLEVGCGTGQLSEGVEAYVGVEVNKAAVEVATELHPRSWFIHADFMDLTPDDIPMPVEVVLAVAVLEHQPKHTRFLTRCAAYEPEAIIFSLFQGWDSRGIIRLKANNGKPVYFNRYKRSSVIDHLKKLGYGKITEVKIEERVLVKAERG